MTITWLEKLLWMVGLPSFIQILTMTYCYSEADALGIPKSFVEINALETVRVGAILLCLLILVYGIFSLLFLIASFMVKAFVTDRIRLNRIKNIPQILLQTSRLRASITAVVILTVILLTDYIGSHVGSNSKKLIFHEKNGDQMLFRRYGDHLVLAQLDAKGQLIPSRYFWRKIEDLSNADIELIRYP